MPPARLTVRRSRRDRAVGSASHVTSSHRGPEHDRRRLDAPVAIQPSSGLARDGPAGRRSCTGRRCPACPGGSTARQGRRAAPPASCERCAARRPCLAVDYLDKPARLRSGLNNQMAQSAWVAMTRETVGRQSAQPPGPRVDAGEQELSEMTIGRTDDPENPLLATAGQPGRVIVWGWIAEPIWASGHAAAPTGRTHDRNRTARQISSTFLLHPGGRPHMRGAKRRSNRGYQDQSMTEIASSRRFSQETSPSWPGLGIDRPPR